MGRTREMEKRRAELRDPLGQVDNVWVASGSGGSYYLQRRGGGGRFIAWRQRVKKRASLRKLD